MQIIIVALLLAQRYKLIGVFAVLPISLALFLFTLQWKGTVFVNIFFLVLSIIVFMLEWSNVKKFFTSKGKTWISNSTKQFFPKAIYSNLSLFLFLLAFAIGALFPNQSMVFMLICIFGLCFVVLDVFQCQHHKGIDRFILILYFLCVVLFAYRIFIQDLFKVNVAGVFMLVGILVLLAAVLFVIRLVKYRRKGSVG